jgi:hypothetical protein
VRPPESCMKRVRTRLRYMTAWKVVDEQFQAPFNI